MILNMSFFFLIICCKTSFFAGTRISKITWFRDIICIFWVLMYMVIYGFKFILISLVFKYKIISRELFYHVIKRYEWPLFDKFAFTRLPFLFFLFKTCTLYIPYISEAIFINVCNNMVLLNIVFREVSIHLFWTIKISEFLISFNIIFTFLLIFWIFSMQR